MIGWLVISFAESNVVEKAYTVRADLAPARAFVSLASWLALFRKRHGSPAGSVGRPAAEKAQHLARVVQRESTPRCPGETVSRASCTSTQYQEANPLVVQIRTPYRTCLYFCYNTTQAVARFVAGTDSTAGCASASFLDPFEPPSVTTSHVPGRSMQ